MTPETMNEETAMEAYKDTEFVALDTTIDADEMAELLEVNMGGKMDWQDMERVVCPSAGALSFEVPCSSGVEPRDDVHGVVLHAQDIRLRFTKEFGEGETNEPDCVSLDGVVGTGDPGMVCKGCPHEKWGTGKNGSGRACNERKYVVMLLPDSMSPVALSVPPSSLKHINKYLKRLYDERILAYKTTTIVKPVAAKNKGGVKYTEITFVKGPDLNEREQGHAKLLSKQIRDSIVGAAEAAAAGNPSAESQRDVDEHHSRQADELAKGHDLGGDLAEGEDPFGDE